MARVIGLDSGGYQVRWYDGRRNDRGKLIETGGQVFARKPDATAEKRRVEKRQRERKEIARLAPGRVLSLGALLTLWAKSSEAGGGTRATYRTEKVAVLTALIDARKWRTVVDVTPEAIDAWQRDRKGVGTEKPLQMLKTLLRYALATHRQPVDHATLLAKPQKRTRRPRPTLLREHEVTWLLALAQVRGGDPALAILDHLASYGCRPVDACLLTCGSVTSEGLRLWNNKNRRWVLHPLLARHVERYVALRGTRADAEPLFLNPYGEAWALTELGQAVQLTSWYRNNVSGWLLPAGQQGIKCLKNYAISRMDALGIDDRTKALFTGHLTLGVFATYKTTNADRAREARDKME